MKLKKILSALLSASLIFSAVPLTVSAAGAIDGTAPESNAASLRVVYDTEDQADVGNKYLRVDNRTSGRGGYPLVWWADFPTDGDGNPLNVSYYITFDVRTPVYTTGTSTHRFFHVYGTNAVVDGAETWQTSTVYWRFNTNNGSNVVNFAANGDDDWQTVRIALDNRSVSAANMYWLDEAKTQPAYMGFTANSADTEPFDIDNFRVYYVDADKTEHDICFYDFDDTDVDPFGENERGKLGIVNEKTATHTVMAKEEGAFTRFVGNGADDIVITYDIENGEAGTYAIEGKIRNAWHGGEAISAENVTVKASFADGSYEVLDIDAVADEASLSNRWLVIDTADLFFDEAPAALSIETTGTASGAVDVKDISFELTEKAPDPSDAGGVMANGTVSVSGTKFTVDDTNDGYLHIEGRNKNRANDGILYTFDTADFPTEGTVYLSFDARTPLETNSGARIRVKNYSPDGTNWTNVETAVNYAALTTEWQNFEFSMPASKFTPGTNQLLQFRGLENSDSVPFDIDNFKVYTKDADGNANDPIVEHDFTEEVTLGIAAGLFGKTPAADDTGVISWESGDKYSRVIGDGEPAGVTYTLDEALEAGIYAFSGDFRFAYYDYNTENAVESDEITVTAVIDGKTVELADVTTVNNSWCTVEGYAIELRHGGKLTEITVKADSDIGVDYKNISFDVIGEIEPIIGGGDGALADIQPTFVGTPVEMTDASENTGDRYLRVDERSKATDRGGVKYYFPEIPLEDGQYAYIAFDARIPTETNAQGKLRLRNSNDSSNYWFDVETSTNAIVISNEWDTYVTRFSQANSNLTDIIPNQGYVHIYGLGFEEGALDTFPFDIDNFKLYIGDADGNVITEIDSQNFEADDVVNESKAPKSFRSDRAQVAVVSVEDEDWTRVKGDGSNSIEIAFDLENAGLAEGNYNLKGAVRFAYYDWTSDIEALVDGTVYSVIALLEDGTEVALVSDAVIGENTVIGDYAATPIDVWHEISVVETLDAAPVGLVIEFADSANVAVDYKNLNFAYIGEADSNYVPESVDLEVVCDVDFVNAGDEFDVEIYAVNTSDKPQKIESFEFAVDCSDGTEANDTVTYTGMVLADAFNSELAVVENGAVSYIVDIGNGDEPVTVEAGARVLVATVSFKATAKKAAEANELTVVTVGVDNAGICLTGDAEFNGYIPNCSAAEIDVYNLVVTVVADNAVRLDGSEFTGDVVYARYGDAAVYANSTRTAEYVYTDYFTASDGFELTGEFTFDGEEFILGTDEFTKNGTLKAITEAVIPAVVYGDIDGDGAVTLADAAILGKIIAKWNGFELPEDITLIDLDADGRVNPLDLVYMVRHIAGWDGYKVLPAVKG